MTSKYSKLSDEILIKKISALRVQALGIIEVLKAIKDFDVSEIENDINNETSCTTRDAMEQLCDKFTDIVNTLKTKQKNVAQAQVQAKQQVQTPKNDDDDDDETIYTDVKPKYEMITSLESIKRAFFNPTSEEYASKPFASQVMEHPFVFYKGIYKYSEDMNNKADYIARNFNKSFVKRMEEYGKYVFAMFICSKLETPTEKQYKYESYMLFNSTGAYEEFMIKDNDDILFEKIDLHMFLEYFKNDTTFFDTLFAH
jgi:hypothetical protein